METIIATSAEARQQWSATVDRAIAGRRVEITRAGRVVAVLYGADHDPAAELAELRGYLTERTEVYGPDVSAG